jgi:hypothetical protein
VIDGGGADVAVLTHLGAILVVVDAEANLKGKTERLICTTAILLSNGTYLGPNTRKLLENA